MAEKSYEALLDEDKQPTNTDKEVEPTPVKVDPEEPKVSEPEPKEEVDEPVAKEPVEEKKEQPVTEEPKEAVEETKPAEPEAKAKAEEPSVEKPVEEEPETKPAKVNVGQDGYAAIKAAEDALKEAEKKTLETYRSSLSGDVASRVQPSYANTKSEPEPEPKAIKEAPVQQQVPEDKELASRIQPSYAQTKKEEEPAPTPVEEPKPAEETPDDILAKLNLSPEKLAAVKAAMSDEPAHEVKEEAEPEPKAVYAAKKGDGKQVVVDGKQTAIDEPEQAPAQEEPVANPVPEPAENFDEKLDTFIHQADSNYRKLFSFLTADERQRYIGATMALRNGEVNTKNILELDKLTTNALEVKEARNK